MTLIRTLETYLSYYPKATYYDVVGLVPQRASIRLFAGPHDQVANRNSMLTLEHVYKPDLIFMVRKINYLKPDIKELIKKDYFPIGASAFGRWRKLDTPLKLPLKNQSELDPLLAQMKQWSGAAELREFTALVETKGKPSRTLQLSPKDLLNRKIVGPRSQLTAISPFTKIDRMTDMLPEIIRFDWDWTGTTDLVDDIPNEELLLKE